MLLEPAWPLITQLEVFTEIWAVRARSRTCVEDGDELGWLFAK
jgi:hypothetical protein